jgi:acetyltransferase
MAHYPNNLMRMIDWCGTPLLIRPVRADDAPRYVAGALLCSVEDLRFRFLRSISRLSEQLASQLTQIDYEAHMVFVAEDLKGNLVAAARLARDVCRKSAECAVIVRTDLQRRGLGRLMLGLLEDYAVKHGVSELWGVMDNDNRKALNLFRKFGYGFGFRAGLPFLRIAKSLA